MRRRTATALEEKPVYTLAEVAVVLKMFRSTGHPDTHKAVRRLRSLGVPVVSGRPQTVHAADVLRHAPRLYQVLLGTPPEHRTAEDM